MRYGPSRPNQLSAWKQMSTSPKMLKFSFKPYNCMDFVCSAFAKQAATSYCSVACMTLGGGMQLRKSTAGFNNACSLCSTTCLSGGYPVTLTCWHYTKHWSLSICNYYSNMDSSNVTMDMVSQAAPFFCITI